MNISLSKTQLRFTGPGGSLRVPNDDEVCRRLAMLIEGQCEGLGPANAAQKYDFTRQRYYQILAAFYAEGARGLAPANPRTQDRLPPHRSGRPPGHPLSFPRSRLLPPPSSLKKSANRSHTISQRSVERIIADYGLQKKTLRP